MKQMIAIFFILGCMSLYASFPKSVKANQNVLNQKGEATFVYFGFKVSFFMETKRY